jgi:hypothetical protein
MHALLTSNSKEEDMTRRVEEDSWSGNLPDLRISIPVGRSYVLALS